VKLPAMTRALVVSAFAVLSAACLTPVDDRWCDTARPCSAGFTCTPSGHCVQTSRADGGTGGGGGRDGGTTGGGAGGGGGGGGMTGGGGGSVTCGAQSCPSGCCLGASCVPVGLQSNATCGFGGAACLGCDANAGCVNGQCVQGPQPIDGGPPALVGGPCAEDMQCGTDGLSFCIPDQSGFPGGYCSRLCDMAPCPSGSECIEAQTQGGDIINLCLVSCTTASQCRMGYTCDQSFCLPP
jgi:hypothetical protein